MPREHHLSSQTQILFHLFFFSPFFSSWLPWLSLAPSVLTTALSFPFPSSTCSIGEILPSLQRLLASFDLQLTSLTFLLPLTLRHLRFFLELYFLRIFGIFFHYLYILHYYSSFVPTFCDIISFSTDLLRFLHTHSAFIFYHLYILFVSSTALFIKHNSYFLSYIILFPLASLQIPSSSFLIFPFFLDYPYPVTYLISSSYNTAAAITSVHFMTILGRPLIPYSLYILSISFSDPSLLSLNHRLIFFCYLHLSSSFHLTAH